MIYGEISCCVLLIVANWFDIQQLGGTTSTNPLSICLKTEYLIAASSFSSSVLATNMLLTVPVCIYVL